jgi:hypothetical protein
MCTYFKIVTPHLESIPFMVFLVGASHATDIRIDCLLLVGFLSKPAFGIIFNTTYI